MSCSVGCKAAPLVATALAVALGWYVVKNASTDSLVGQVTALVQNHFSRQGGFVAGMQNGFWKSPVATLPVRR